MKEPTIFKNIQSVGQRPDGTFFYIPYICQNCSQSSEYGFQGAWYCGGCWQLVFKSWQN